MVKITVGIDGMACGMCEAHIKEALAEIRRVLKPGGILIVPTFTASGSISGRMRIWFMELSGFKVYHKWTSQEYLDFLRKTDLK